MVKPIKIKVFEGFLIRQLLSRLDQKLIMKNQNTIEKPKRSRKRGRKRKNIPKSTSTMKSVKDKSTVANENLIQEEKFKENVKIFIYFIYIY